MADIDLRAVERYLLSYIGVLVVAYLAARWHNGAVNEAYRNGRQNHAVEAFMTGGQGEE